MDQNKSLNLFVKRRFVQFFVLLLLSKEKSRQINKPDVDIKEDQQARGRSPRKPITKKDQQARGQ